MDRNFSRSHNGYGNAGGYNGNDSWKPESHDNPNSNLGYWNNRAPDNRSFNWMNFDSNYDLSIPSAANHDYDLSIPRNYTYGGGFNSNFYGGGPIPGTLPSLMQLPLPSLFFPGAVVCEDPVMTTINSMNALHTQHINFDDCRNKDSNREPLLSPKYSPDKAVQRKQTPTEKRRAQRRRARKRKGTQQEAPMEKKPRLIAKQEPMSGNDMPQLEPLIEGPVTDLVQESMKESSTQQIQQPAAAEENLREIKKEAIKENTEPPAPEVAAVFSPTIAPPPVKKERATTPDYEKPMPSPTNVGEMFEEMPSFSNEQEHQSLDDGENDLDDDDSTPFYLMD